VSSQAEPSAFRMMATLTVAGLASGLLLVGVYELTLPIIERNAARALQRAVFEVIPGTTQMQRLVDRDGRLVATPDAQDDDAPAIYVGHSAGGRITGYAIPAQGPGFQDIIKIIYGYDPGRDVIVGMQVLESKETPGIGDKIYKDEAFLANFVALAVEPAIVPVPEGTRSEPNQVDAISGATISSKAMVKILNAGNERWLGLIPEGDPWTAAGAGAAEAVP